MYHTVRSWHRWAGVIAALFLLLISCTGFLLAIAVAPFVTYRIFGAIRKLQSATHRIATGDFDYDPQIPVGDEISDQSSVPAYSADEKTRISDQSAGDAMRAITRAARTTRAANNAARA